MSAVLRFLTWSACAIGAFCANLLAANTITSIIVFLLVQSLAGAGIGYLVWAAGNRIHPDFRDISANQLAGIIVIAFILIGMILLLSLA